MWVVGWRHWQVTCQFLLQIQNSSLFILIFLVVLKCEYCSESKLFVGLGLRMKNVFPFSGPALSVSAPFSPPTQSGWEGGCWEASVLCLELLLSSWAWWRGVLFVRCTMIMSPRAAGPTFVGRAFAARGCQRRGLVPVLPSPSWFQSVGCWPPAGCLIAVKSGSVWGSHDLPPARSPQVTAHCHLISCHAPDSLIYKPFPIGAHHIGPIIFW